MMIKELIKYFENKKVLILGCGREGISTYKLIRKYLKNQEIYIADEKQDFQGDYEVFDGDESVHFISGEMYLEGLENYDVIMKSPGISFAGIDTSKYVHKIKSQLELLLEFFDVTTIGITGTKGKSTTTTLIYNMLQEQGVRSLLLGNIGVPVFDFIEEIKKDDVVVLEMSSHQLEYMQLSPNIAILLNVFEEHLDHYNSFEGYANAKCNIYKHQKENDYFLYNVDNEMLNKCVKKSKANVYKVSFNGKAGSNVYIKDDYVYFNDKSIYNVNEKRNLFGDYNLNNIMFVLGVSEILKLDINKTIQTIRNFKTLEHRLEFVGKYDDVLYYDNSIATVPAAVIEAVKALENVDTLIIGGMDRGIDYSEFVDFLNSSSIENIVCMPKTGHDIAKRLNNGKAYVVNDLAEAVEVSKRVTKKGKSCLLAPAAASYGFFKNFEEKGDLYKKLVRGM